MSTQTIDSTDQNSAPTRRPGESPRQQSVCIEIPVTVHGSRSASASLNNSQAAKPFLEETRTMIVFPQGAVLRLTEPVSEGQILILKNPRVKQEVACRVVSSKTNASAKGYVEVEFFQAAAGFWGITFPAASSITPTPAESAPSAPAPRQTRFEPAAAKPAFFQPPVAAPKPVAPVVPLVSKPAPPPAPAPVIPAAVIPDPPAPVAAAPIAEAAIAPVLTPDSTQELNRAIAAAYAAPVEPPKPVQKTEPVQEMKAVKDSPVVSAPPSPYITESLPPAANKSVNPTKPKTATPAKASPEIFSSSEPLATAESIGYPSSEFAAYSAPATSAKQNRTSAPATASPVVTRKVELTSSQIASETVLGKPMFSSNAGESTIPGRRSSRTWIIAVAAVVLLAGGAGAYWWTLSHKLGAAKPDSVSAAALTTAPSTVPASNSQPGTAPAGTDSQPTNNPNAAQNSARTQKPGSVLSGPPGSASISKTDKNSAVLNARRPTVLPSARIAAPVTHADSSSIATTPAPDVISKTSIAPSASLSAILPGMAQPSAVPAPPPASKPAGPPPVASVLQQPKLLQSNSPIYPKIAATRGDWGDVIIDAVVGETGKVTDAKIISGPDTLRQSALQVVRTQTYQPAKLNGKPVSMHVTVKIPFPKPR